MNQYRHLSAFPENKEVLAALKAKGVVTGILSNGDPEMLGVAVRSAGLEGLLDHVLSVDGVRKYKTHPDAYALGPQATGLDAETDRLRQLQRLGRAGRHLVRLPHALGQPLPACPSRNWARSPRAPAPACATSSLFSDSTSISGEQSMTARTPVHGLQVATELHRFIEDKVLPGTGVDSAAFWKGFDAIVADLAPRNIALLAERDRLQAELDRWHKANPGPIRDMAAYRGFLEKIGYLVPPPADVRKATTANVDAELALQAGPQLVVPILNARYALNAANARWGSLYDALYGTDAIPETGGAEKGKGYNPVRGAKVIAFARQFLDQVRAAGRRLARGRHRLQGRGRQAGRGTEERLRDRPEGRGAVHRLPGRSGRALFGAAAQQRHPRRHPDRPHHPHRQADAAGISDVVLEAALSTILDLEDSVAVVDAQDKVLAYSNWLGILQGTLTEQVTKGGKTFTRGLNARPQVHRPPMAADVQRCMAARCCSCATSAT